VGGFFPELAFRFCVTGGGRKVSSPLLVYGDMLHTQPFHFVDGAQQEHAGASCTVFSSWGGLSLSSDGHGFLQADALPPGGITLSVGETFAHFETEER